MPSKQSAVRSGATRTPDMDGPVDAAISPRDRARARRGQAEDIRRAGGDGGLVEALFGELQSGPAGATGQTIPVDEPLLRSLAAEQGRLPAGSQQGESVPTIEAGDTGTAEVVSGQLFTQGAGDEHDVDMNDVRQGLIGDCYFVAVLAAIARVRPDLIRDMVRDNGDGTYTVTFQIRQGFSGLFGAYSDKTVTVDGTFWQSDGSPIYAGPGDSGPDGAELWVMVIEKAWAELHGGYGEITGGNVDGNARTALTGTPPTGSTRPRCRTPRCSRASRRTSPRATSRPSSGRRATPRRSPKTAESSRTTSMRSVTSTWSRAP